MGASGSKSRGLWPFGSGGPGGSECPGGDQALARARGLCSATPFVFTRRGQKERAVWCCWRRDQIESRRRKRVARPDEHWADRQMTYLRLSMYYDEDGDLAHEFYEETIVTKNGRKRAKLKRIHKNLIPQGIVKLEHPRLHVDFPVIICEA